MSDLPMTVDQIRAAIASYETVLEAAKAAITAADTDDSIDFDTVVEMVRTRVTLEDIVSKLTGLADELAVDRVLELVAA